jgi:hypothetical protein
MMPVIKRGGLGSSYQERRVGIQLSREAGWDPVIKRGGKGYSDQEAQPSSLDNWIPALLS